MFTTPQVIHPSGNSAKTLICWGGGSVTLSSPKNINVTELASENWVLSDTLTADKTYVIHVGAPVLVTPSGGANFNYR